VQRSPSQSQEPRAKNFNFSLKDSCKKGKTQTHFQKHLYSHT
jgi:hypothetical protein